MMAFEIGSRRVGPGAPCFVIAEAGVNHNGDPALARELVDVAARSGADAVKFQTFSPEALTSPGAEAAPYQRATGSRSQREMLETLTLPSSVLGDLVSQAAGLGITFLSTAFDLPSLEVLLQLGVSVLKVPSGEIDNLSFITALAGADLPLIISTGLATMAEVEAAARAARSAPALALMHCVTAYPAPASSANLRAISTMADRFRVPVGWSDHTTGVVTALGAIALGATLIEKHVTTDCHLPGPDHRASSEPDRFAAYVAAVRELESALGDGVKRPAAIEEANRVHVRRSHHAARDLSVGSVLDEGDAVLLRPATGLPPGNNPVGRRVLRRVAAGQPLTADDLG